MFGWGKEDFRIKIGRHNRTLWHSSLFHFARALRPVSWAVRDGSVRGCVLPRYRLYCPSLRGVITKNNCLRDRGPVRSHFFQQNFSTWYFANSAHMLETIQKSPRLDLRCRYRDRVKISWLDEVATRGFKGCRIYDANQCHTIAKRRNFKKTESG